MPAYSQAADPAAPPLLVKVEEAARLLATSRRAIYYLLDSGELPSIKINTRRRIPREALEAYVGRQLAASGAGAQGRTA